MSQENVEAFKRGLEAGNRGDVETLLEELDPEVEWHSALHALLGGEQTVFRGHDGVREMLRDLNEAFSEIHIEISEIRDLGTDSSRSAATAHVAGEAGPRPRRPWRS
jgi:ketosteroid isomerase-like protein